MTRKEAERLTRQRDTLRALGFTPIEAEALRRISMTLHRWSEHECNGHIQREGENGDGKPFWHSSTDGRKLYRVPDRERGALKRLARIMQARNRRAVDAALDSQPDIAFTALQARQLDSYVQSDPRGASLYILRPGDVPEGGSVDSYYSRGIAVY